MNSPFEVSKKTHVPASGRNGHERAKPFLASDAKTNGSLPAPRPSRWADDEEYTLVIGPRRPIAALPSSPSAAEPASSKVRQDDKESSPEPAKVSEDHGITRLPSAGEEMKAPVQAHSPAPAAAAAEPADDAPPAIRQLEVRAVFGVDHELNEGELMQRSRNLPGIRSVTRVPDANVAGVQSMRGMLHALGFGAGAVKLVCGENPLEFIAVGRVVLAVQTDGGFAPGVRETLMIVARELDRM